ncbi:MULTISPECIES: hypothetical protein, partial [unclassified Pseudomonas]
MTDTPIYPLLIEQNRSENYRETPKLEATLKKNLMKKTPIRTALIYSNAVLFISLGIAALLLDENGTVIAGEQTFENPIEAIITSSRKSTLSINQSYKTHDALQELS